MWIDFPQDLHNNIYNLKPVSWHNIGVLRVKGQIKKNVLNKFLKAQIESSAFVWLITLIF